jgi:hypothetical protein
MSHGKEKLNDDPMTDATTEWSDDGMVNLSVLNHLTDTARRRAESVIGKWVG